MEWNPGSLKHTSKAGIGNARLFGLTSIKKKTRRNEGVGVGKSPRAQVMTREGSEGGGRRFGGRKRGRKGKLKKKKNKNLCLSKSFH